MYYELIEHPACDLLRGCSDHAALLTNNCRRLCPRFQPLAWARRAEPGLSARTSDRLKELKGVQQRCGQLGSGLRSEDRVCRVCDCRLWPEAPAMLQAWDGDSIVLDGDAGLDLDL